ncbi:MAG: hypothetical protein HQM14_02880 [SAR324 cluster bacterium]|nr:hypothetical protein [SAR324 cluster bacterium]
MKKRQDQFLQAIRWGLIVFFFGIMFFGFFMNYQRSLSRKQVPKIETKIADAPEKKE